MESDLHDEAYFWTFLISAVLEAVLDLLVLKPIIFEENGMDEQLPHHINEAQHIGLIHLLFLYPFVDNLLQR